MGRGRTPDGRRRRDCRQRHAPGSLSAEHLVSRVDDVDRYARAPAHRRHPARCADAHCRQQRRCRLGLHEHDRRLERPRRHRGRSGRPQSLSHTRRDAGAAGVDRDHPREGRHAGRRRRARDDLGTGRWQGCEGECACAGVGATARRRPELRPRRGRDGRDPRAAFRRRCACGRPGAEHDGGAARWPHRMVDRGAHPAPRGLRRTPAGVVGRRVAGMGRLARGRRVSARHRSRRRADRHRQQPPRGRPEVAGARRWRLRHRRTRPPDSPRVSPASSG